LSSASIYGGLKQTVYANNTWNERNSSDSDTQPMIERQSAVDSAGIEKKREMFSFFSNTFDTY
jgi:hypothetical protein